MTAHVVAGAIAVASGATALFAKKGSRLHRASGALFFVFMLITAGAGAFRAIQKPEMITFLAGVFTCYLAGTSWVTIMRRDGSRDPFVGFALPAALAIAAAGAYFGIEAQNSASGVKDGYSAEPYFIFGALALFSALADISVMARRGVVGAHRIARHLWRMCLALYIAVGSLFTGPGSAALPDELRGSPWLSAPEMIVIAAMLFWLIRVLFTKWARER